LKYLSLIDFTCANMQPLSAEDEYHLAKTHDCGESRQRLIQSQMKLAKNMAQKYFSRGATAEDFFQEIMIGVAGAVDNFAPDKGFRLSTYAHWKVKHRIFETLRKNQSMVMIEGLPFRLQANFRQAERHVKKVCSDQDAFEIDVEMAKRLKVSVEQVQEIRMRLEREESLDAPVRSDDGEGRARIDILESLNVTPAEDVENDNFQRELSHVFNVTCDEVFKNAREKDIFRQRWLVEDGLSNVELGQKYGVSHQRISQIEKAVYARIQEWVKSNRSDLHRALINS
jgi:RNA polymerase sigma-32 factor